MPKTDVTPYLFGSEGWDIARRRAEFGTFEWVMWKGRDGVLRATHATAETVKVAMLAVGTQGRIRITVGSHMLMHGWKSANNVRLQLLHPYENRVTYKAEHYRKHKP